MKTLFSTLALAVTLTVGAAEAKKDVVLFVPAHPDDMVVALGFCHLAKDVYDLHVVDLTHGERGCGEEKFTNGWTKVTRTKEEEAVCKTINAKLHWLDEIDGEAYAGRDTCHRLAELIKELKPRAVIGHWPVDIHTDHVMAGAAMQRAIFLSEVKCEVWFFGQTYQSKRWTPDVLVDVTGVMDEIVESIKLYTCQLQGDSVVERQKLMREFYGYQSRRYYDGRCEGYKAMILPMAGDRTIFTDLPKPKGFQEGFDFEGSLKETGNNVETR